MNNKFTHGGATGDIIFSLPTIKAMGGGELYITKYDEQRAMSIAKLIRVQPYIKAVHVVDVAPEGCINLNKFREHAGHHQNLVEAHFKGQGLQVDETWKNGWLTLPNLTYFVNDIHYSVINRTTNYADPNFDWAKEYDYLKELTGTVLFIGYKDEYKLFCEKFKRFPTYFECDFLRAAYLIKDAYMFTGCYSAMSTIAMGLGINYRLEQAPGHTCSSLLMPREIIINV